MRASSARRSGSPRRLGLLIGLPPGAGGVLLCVAIASGCVTVTPAGAYAAVYRASRDAPAAQRAMPSGCRVLSASPPIAMTELEMEGDKVPFRIQRNDAAAAGANVLLVLSRLTVSRHDVECPHK